MTPNPNRRGAFARRIGATLVYACAVLILLAPATAQNESNDADWTELFNGKNLDGWTVKITGHEINENFARTFRVEDGLLKVR